MAGTKFKTDDRGRVRLYVGYWINSKGKRVQRPFFFGTDHSLVPSRLARVNEIWQHEVKRWETPRQRPHRLMADPVARDGKPVWSGWGLQIAVQLAAGKTQIVVPNVHRTTAYVYAENLRKLSTDWPMVHFVAEDTEAAAQGEAIVLAARDHAIAKLNERYDLPENLLKTKSESLHSAFNAYIKAIQTENVEPTESGPQLSAWGEIRTEHVQRLKLHHSDQPMSALDFDGCQKLIDYWRNRPLSNKNKPMSVAYCEHHIAELRRFFKWTSKAKQFSWRKPEDFEELNCKVRKISSEKTDISFVRVPTHTVEELATIYKHASDLQRLLLLLGLNCGFRGAEMGTVENKHLFLNGHPNAKFLKKYNYDIRPGDGFLLYSRHKTDGETYGEYLLWPETIKAINWMLDRKKKLGFEQSPLLLITHEGTPFYRRTIGNKNVAQIFANKWTKLHEKVKKSNPDFRWLPFGTLRDTSSDLIRHIADGETTSCFLIHGSASKDNLLDLYSNRPFGKVFDALRIMREQLDPMFAAASNAFDSESLRA